MTLKRGRTQKGVRGECRSGKLRFVHRKAAEEALAKAQHSTDVRRAEVRVYPCPQCSGFHLTSIPPRKVARLLACGVQHPEIGVPCHVPAGHDGFPHRWDSPCPGDMPSVEWSDAP
jgi:hypothetical protein